ncbi:MAG: ABC transporter permease subunit [Hyphomicrobiaceae bacterium]|nr:ABC transporter permease subunit [Hyphomicrobiaceae bacterium]
MRRKLVDFVLLVLLVGAVWQGLHHLVGEEALSAPGETIAYLLRYLRDPKFWMHAGATSLALGYALAIAIGGGLLIGLPLGLNRAAGDVADPYLIALFSIPKITLYPVILLLFGLSLSGKVAFGAIHGLFPIALFTMSGVRSIPRTYLKTARAMRLSRFDTIRSVAFPAALPEIVTGVRIGTASTILGTLIGEMFAATEGLGFVLIKAIERNEVQIIMALTLLLFIVSSTLNTLLLVLEHRLHRRAAVVGREAGAPAAR